MADVKQRMLDILNQVSTKDETLYDIIYNHIFFTRLQESEEDIKNGRVCTLEELDEEMESKYESYRNAKR